MVERAAPLLQARGLAMEFPSRASLFRRAEVRPARVVDNVDLTIVRGRTLGVVGESGCGKSTLGRLLIRLLEPTAGTLLFEGRDIAHLDAARLRPLRRRFQMIFQDPMGSLDPRLRVGESVAEPLLIAGEGNRATRRLRALELIEQVGLSPELAQRYPHEFSGGQRQRICIARALTLRPDLIVADEPVSALDVSVRAQIVNLLREVQAAYSVAYLFISHDLGVVRHVADNVAVMYLGEIVEQGRAHDIIDRPAHPYAQALRKATPVPRVPSGPRRAPVRGEATGGTPGASGCRFMPRCAAAISRCADERPVLRPIGDGRQVACHRV